jgi:hypothetical protein
MTLLAVPAWNWVMLMTTDFSGSTFRLTTVWTAW